MVAMMSLAILLGINAFAADYADLPKINGLSPSVKKIAHKRKVTNLLLAFLDFHTPEDAFKKMKANGFATSNLIETVNDLKAYGCNIDIPATAEEYRTKVYPALMEMHAKVGYYGVQIPVGGVGFDKSGIITKASVELFKRQKKIVEKAGLKASAAGGSWMIDWTQCIKPQIQAAEILGSKFLYGPFSTPFMHFPKEVPSGTASTKWVATYHAKLSKKIKNEIGPFAKAHGVILCDEPLQRFEKMPVRLKEAIALALKADSPQYQVMIDTCHEFADGGGPEIFKRQVETLIAAKKLNGIHVSPVHRGKLYESWFNEQFFISFFKPLFDNGYTGEISIETFDAISPIVEPAKINREKFKHPVGVMINQLIYTTTMLSKVN